MKREDLYKQQLQELGIYDPAFDSEIKTLAKLERRRARADKAWHRTAPQGCEPSFLDPHYAVLVQLENSIHAHREALGLTPKALRRIKGAFYDTVRISAQVEDPIPQNVTVLDSILQKYGLEQCE